MLERTFSAPRWKGVWDRGAGGGRRLHIQPVCVGHLLCPELPVKAKRFSTQGSRSIWSSRQLSPSLASPAASALVQAMPAQSSTMWANGEGRQFEWEWLRAAAHCQEEGDREGAGNPKSKPKSKMQNKDHGPGTDLKVGGAGWCIGRDALSYTE